MGGEDCGAGGGAEQAVRRDAEQALELADRFAAGALAQEGSFDRLRMSGAERGGSPIPQPLPAEEAPLPTTPLSAWEGPLPITPLPVGEGPGEGAPPHPQAHPILAPGASGAAVRQLQRLLSLKQDGIFGPATRIAVLARQRAAGLTADGIVGPRTWAALGE